MDTARGLVESPVALTPDGRLRLGDKAFSFEGPSGLERKMAISHVPHYHGVRIMFTQDNLPAYMAIMGMCCATPWCALTEQ